MRYKQKLRGSQIDAIRGTRFRNVFPHLLYAVSLFKRLVQFGGYAHRVVIEPRVVEWMHLSCSVRLPMHATTTFVLLCACAMHRTATLPGLLDSIFRSDPRYCVLLAWPSRT
mmetsp:Transcript_104704/g.337505  ORF Transcript_104704/g.337505 Transcript_104704/m.337505 type:complete len:112 (-) Transcript_104704:79-414(-)